MSEMNKRLIKSDFYYIIKLVKFSNSEVKMLIKSQILTNQAT